MGTRQQNDVKRKMEETRSYGRGWRVYEGRQKTEQIHKRNRACDLSKGAGLVAHVASDPFPGVPWGLLDLLKG